MFQTFFEVQIRKNNWENIAYGMELLTEVFVNSNTKNKNVLFQWRILDLLSDFFPCIHYFLGLQTSLDDYNYLVKSL